MPDFEMDFEHRGAGTPTLVFVPGFMCELGDWRHQVAHFEKTNETYALNLRGVSQSPPGQPDDLTIEQLGQDVADFLDHNDLWNAVLVGHSMGCRVVTEACVRAPDRVAGLVVIDAGRTVGPFKNALAYYDQAISERGFPGWINATFSTMFFDGIPAWGAEIIERVASTPEEIGVPLQRDIFRHDEHRLPDILADVKVPILIIQSTARASKGGIRPVEPGETVPWQQLANDLGIDYEIEYHVGPGHFNMIEDPDPVNARIAQFITERVAN